MDGVGGIASHARHAEDVGLESVWVGDHLIPLSPVLESTLVLATAAAATERVEIGFGVLILALRPVTWAAKQVATLQHLSGDRVLLGADVRADPQPRLRRPAGRCRGRPGHGRQGGAGGQDSHAAIWHSCALFLLASHDL